jgi:hypothetical protein
MTLLGQEIGARRLYDRTVERHSIRWSSADVEPVGDFYELRVELEDGPTEKWIDCLNEEAARLYRAQRNRPWGLVGLSGRTLVVQDLDEGSEDALKAYLVELLRAAERAAEARRNGTRPDAQAAALRHREVAQRMAHRFRAYDDVVSIRH